MDRVAMGYLVAASESLRSDFHILGTPKNAFLESKPPAEGMG
jgi:hypothetical protein